LSGIKIEPVEESPFHLKGSFPGPQDTPYEGGHFEVVSLFNALLNHFLTIVFVNATGYRHPRVISISARENEVHHQGLSSKYLFCIRRDLSGYPQGCMVSGFDSEIDIDFPPKSPVFARAE
jgi:hypothetical protein